MSSDDLDKLWKQIDSDLDQDENIEVDEYLKKRGFKASKLSSLSDQVQSVIDKAFAETSIS